MNEFIGIVLGLALFVCTFSVIIITANYSSCQTALSSAQTRLNASDGKVTLEMIYKPISYCEIRAKR